MWHIPKHIHPFWTCLGTRDAVITIYKNIYDYVYITWLFDFTYYFRYDNPSRVSRLQKAMHSADRGVRSKDLRLVHVSTQMDPALQVFPQVSVTDSLTITTNFHVVMVCQYLAFKVFKTVIHLQYFKRLGLMDHFCVSHPPDRTLVYSTICAGIANPVQIQEFTWEYSLASPP